MRVKNIMILLVLISAVAIPCASAQVYSVGDGYEYRDVQAAIDAAGDYDTVELHGEFIITETIEIDKPLTLKGDGMDYTVITTSSRAYFADSMNPTYLQISGTEDVEITGIYFKGPATSTSNIMDKSSGEWGGHGDYHNAVKLYGGNHDIEIHDCRFSLLLGDAIRSNTAVDYNNKYYNNIIDTAGHDGIQLWNDYNTEIYNNKISVICNCGVRLSGCSYCYAHDNTFTNGLTNSGWTDFEIQGKSSHHVISNNLFYKTTDNFPYSGYSHTGTNITITDNAYYETMSPEINRVSGVTESRNVNFDTEQNWIELGYGFDESKLDGNKEDEKEDEDMGYIIRWYDATTQTRGYSEQPTEEDVNKVLQYLTKEVNAFEIKVYKEVAISDNI